MRFLAATTLAAVLIIPAHANDSIGSLETGGLVLKKTADIEMRNEDLYISMAKIEVKYVFKNLRDHDVTETIAFPVPDETTQYYSPTALPDSKTEYLLDFKTEVDGKPVAVTTEQKVFVDNVADQQADATDYAPMLREMKIPLRVNAEETKQAIARLSEADRKKLLDLELLMEDGPADNREYIPSWRLKTTYYWQQTFPAGKEVRIDHRYTPALGGMSAFSLFSDKDIRNGDYYKDFVARYCIEDSFVKAAEAIAARRDGTNTQVFTNDIAYILKTGSNWAAPIGDFRLIIEKDKPQTLVSFCGDDVKKISPTKIEMRKKDFLPQQDLNILFLQQSTE